MDTLQEALFRTMLNNGWFTGSDGNVEAPTGYFGWMVNSIADWFEVYNNFEHEIKTYAKDEFATRESQDAWLKANFAGAWVARIDSNGIIHIARTGEAPVMGLDVMATEGAKIANDLYQIAVEEFGRWEEEAEEHVRKFYEETGAGDPAEFYRHGGGTTVGNGGF